MKLLQWNLENLFISLDLFNNENLNEISEEQWQKMTIAREPNKSLVKIQEISSMVLNQNPDICIFSEVGGRESLENFNKYFLNDLYKVYMTKSNSKRGIDIGFLVKKELPYKVKIKSNRFFELDSKMSEKSKFSRDIPELRLFENQQMKMIIMGVHFKSKASLGDDFFGVETRASEVRGLVKIYNRVKNKYQVPIIVAGDFNGQVYEESEFEPLHLETKLVDFHEWKDSTMEDRATFVRIEPYKLNQLDYILVDEELKPKINLENCRVLKYKTFYDIDLPFPTSFNEKRKLPSDHYPQIIELNFA